LISGEFVCNLCLLIEIKKIWKERNEGRDKDWKNKTNTLWTRIVFLRKNWVD